MRKALFEVKKLKKTKPKKPKKLDIKEFLNIVMPHCYSIILEESNFKQFCEQEKISQEVARKVKDFAKSKSFLSYIYNPVVAIVNNPKYALLVPTQENAQEASQYFGLVILRNLVEDLETESVESVSAKADEIMQAFQKMTGEKIPHELSQVFEDVPI